jgi:hypothetical protein
MVLPVLPPRAFGIDIGKEYLHVCAADPTQVNARKWVVTVIKYEDPQWYVTLSNLIPDGSIVAAEPTGWHYFQPLVTVLQDRVIWQVGHQIVAAIRKIHLAKAKTDHIDSQSLALIAQQISVGEPPRGVRLYHHEFFVEAHALRMLLNEKRATQKQATRLGNQLDALSHSVWPACAIRREAFLTLFNEGIPQARDLKTAVQVAATQNRRSTALRQLAADIPAGLPVNPYTIQAIAQRVPALRLLEAQIKNLDDALAAALTSPTFAPIAARLLTVPCMSLDLIAAILVATDARPDLMTISQFKAAIGYHPTSFSSGNTDRARRTKSGYRPAKALLYMLAQNLVNPRAANPANVIAQYYDSEKKNMSACRRKLTGILWAIASREGAAWKERPDPRVFSTRPDTIRMNKVNAAKRAAGLAPILAAAAQPGADADE